MRCHGNSPSERLRSKTHLAIAAFDRHPHILSMLLTIDASRDPHVELTLASYQQLSHEWLYEERQLLSHEQPAEISNLFWAFVQSGLTHTAISGEDNATVTAQ